MKELRFQTINEALQLGEADYRMYTAVHELGHATSGLATGDCYVDHVRLTIHPAAPSDGHTDLRYDGRQTHLVVLHGGLLAQQRWMREQGLWSDRRAKATRYSAGHDLKVVRSLGASEEETAAAVTRCEKLLNEHWTGLLAAARQLFAVGYLAGDDLCGILNR